MVRYVVANIVPLLILDRETLRLCDELKSKHGVKFGVLSGGRWATVRSRAPFLPSADA
jgi:hypothetical protein